MRAAAIAFIHNAVRPLVPTNADFYDAASVVDVEERLQSRRGWVKLYMPSEEGDDQPMEQYLITIDCGAFGMEVARSIADEIRQGLLGSFRSPSPFHRVRIVALNEGQFQRVQLSYQLQRPAL